MVISSFSLNPNLISILPWYLVESEEGKGSDFFFTISYHLENSVN